jgi:PAS domain S-box-containing protein
MCACGAGPLYTGANGVGAFDRGLILPRSALPIRYKVPLLVCGLLLAGAIASSWVAYVELRRAALTTAYERLADATGQLTERLVTSADRRKGQTARLAAHSAVVAYMRAPEVARSAAAAAVLDSVSGEGEAVATVELWGADGTLRLAAGEPHPSFDPESARQLLSRFTAGDSAIVGPFRTVTDTALYATAAPVISDGTVLGYAVRRRRISGSPEASQLIRDLIGPGAALFLGNAQGDVWTDLSKTVPGPPIEVRTATDTLLQYERPDVGWRLAAAESVPGTPWLVLLEFPRAPVLVGAQGVAARMALLTAALAALGLIVAWTLTRRITKPLGALAAAAGAIAEGDYSRRLTADRRDELGELASAFNTMTEHVERAQHRLEQKVAERTAELRASEMQFHTLAVTAHDAIVIADREGKITYVNPGAERAFGYSPGDVQGKPLTVLMPERFHEAHRRGLQRYLTTGEARVIGRTVELAGRRKDGEEFPVELSIASLGDSGRDGFAGILRDVTDRKRADDALRHSAAELRAANEELEAFSYSVSHDLRAPLRSIDGFCLALLEDAADDLDDLGREHLQRVRAASQRMAQLIDDMLDLSRVTRAELHRERVDLTALANEIVADLTKGQRRRADIVIAPDLDAQGDRRLLRVVLENLIGNAWKFTGGRPGARIEVGAEGTEGRTVFYVRDNGAGFDMTYAGKLFTPFHRLHGPAEFEGTGIGLATVQRIVHRHGGRVWAEGAVNEGATIRFTLDHAEMPEVVRHE